MKSLFTAYVLWLFLGAFGAHHYYLNRKAHALLYATSLGFFLLGWLRDLFMIPTYVNAANRDPAFLDDISVKLRYNKRPGILSAATLAMMMFAPYFRSMVLESIPYISLTVNRILTVPVGGAAVALVVYAIGNEGSRKCDLRTIAKAAAIGEILAFFFSGANEFPTSSFAPSLAAVVGYIITRQYRPPSEPLGGEFQRITGFQFIVIAFSFYAIFSQSRFTTTMFDTFMPDTVANACNDLGIMQCDGLTLDVVKKAYKQTVLKYHPDKCAQDRQAECTEMFQRAVDAYELLTARVEDEDRRKAAFGSDHQRSFEFRFGEDILKEGMRKRRN